MKNLLDEKYKVTSIRGIDLILGRVKDNLALLYNEERNLLERCSKRNSVADICEMTGPDTEYEEE